MKIKYIFGSLLSLMLLSSCEDVLEPKTTTSFGDEYIWTIPTMAKGVLEMGYTGLPSRPDVYGSNFLDCATDNALTSAKSSSVYKLSQGSMTDYNNPIGDWDECYNRIQYVNLFLENGLTDELVYERTDLDLNEKYKERLEGEAYFLRAYWHFRLLRIYGGKGNNGKALGVVMLDKYLTQEDTAKFEEFTRPTYQASVDFILDDLNKAIALLPKDYTSSTTYFDASEYGRATSLAAGVLKSRVLLYSASPAFQDDAVVKINGMGDFTVVDDAAYKAKWADVATEMATIFDLDGFPAINQTNTATAKTFADIVTTGAGFTDIAFRRYFNNRNMESTHFPPFYLGTAQTTPSHNLVMAFNVKANGYPASHPASGVSETDMEDLYSKLETRFAMNVKYNGQVFGTSGVALDIAEGGKDSQSYDSDATATGYYLSKFISTDHDCNDPITGINVKHNNPLLRFTEVHLNYAEAANEAWGADGGTKTARSVIADVRKYSADITSDDYLATITSTEDMRALIQNERRLEFAFEDHRYFDMRRCLLDLNEPIEGVKITKDGAGNNVYEVVEVESRIYETKHYYAPLQYDETFKNDNLINNLGY